MKIICLNLNLLIEIKKESTLKLLFVKKSDGDGTDFYYIAHTIIGRIVFYILQVILYFYVFTKPQVLGMKTGGFGYDKKEDKTTGKGSTAS